MTVRAGKILIVLSLPALVIAGLMLNFIWVGYRAQDAIGGVALACVGSLLLALGLGRVKSKALGLVVFVVGAGGAVGIQQLAVRKSARVRGDIEREIAAGKAAEAVCNGTGAPEASAPGDHGMHPLLRVTFSSNITGGVFGPWTGKEEWAPPSLAELQLVACVHVDETPVASCAYHGKDGTDRYLTKNKLEHRIEIREARTAKLLETKFFEGPAPSDECATEIVERDGQAHGDFRGDPPNHDEETAWLRTFVERAER